MNSLNIKTQEEDYIADMDISEAVDGFVTIEAQRGLVWTQEYTRVVIDKEQAGQIVSHLKKEFGL